MLTVRGGDDSRDVHKLNGTVVGWEEGQHRVGREDGVVDAESHLRDENGGVGQGQPPAP